MRRAVGEVFARPEYHWVPRRHPLQWLGHWLHTLLAWLNRMDETHHTVFQLLLWVAIVVLLSILVHFGYLAWRIYRSTVQPGRPAPVAPGLQLEDAGAHLRRAEELARSGRFAEALAHRFTAVILQLDRARALQFHPSKTPAEYAGEAALDAAGRATLTGLVARLYRHVFGAAPCDATGYSDFGDDAQLVLQHVLPH
ncbi:MAG TPA: hypothetical protein VEO73_00510 [Gemmatimonadales bacterium]|nr:hypothetical protein [Gemmatimonadales bacterium]